MQGKAKVMGERRKLVAGFKGRQGKARLIYVFLCQCTKEVMFVTDYKKMLSKLTASAIEPILKPCGYSGIMILDIVIKS